MRTPGFSSNKEHTTEKYQNLNWTKKLDWELLQADNIQILHVQNILLVSLMLQDAKVTSTRRKSSMKFVLVF